MTELVYRERILDHYRNPRHFGPMAKPTHSAGLQNVSCGDSVQLYAQIINNVVKKISFTGAGCAVSIASTSLLCEFAEGKKMAVLKKLGPKDIEKLLGIPISGAREKCAMLGLETMKSLKKHTDHTP